MIFLNKKQKGISVVEIIVASAIIGISVTALTGAIQLYLKIVYQNTRETQAVMLLDETAEALQYLRDDSFVTHFENIQESTEYTIFWNGIAYEFTTSTISLPYEMSRTITFENVERDASDQLSDSGTIDPNTKKANISITWPYANEQKTIEAELLIHNIYEN